LEEYQIFYIKTKRVIGRGLASVVKKNRTEMGGCYLWFSGEKVGFGIGDELSAEET